MKINVRVLPISFFLILFFQGCTDQTLPVNEQPASDSNAQSLKVDQQLSDIEEAIGKLAETIYGSAAIKTDTAAAITRLDSLPAKDRDAQVLAFRLDAIRESLTNLSGGFTDKALTAKECKRVITGYKSCNCAPNPNGTIHCDLCPIYKWVCQ
jgi:hypothetical protein